MDININVKDGDEEFGVDIHDCAVEDLIENMRVAAQMLHEKLAPLDLDALKKAYGH